VERRMNRSAPDHATADTAPAEMVAILLQSIVRDRKLACVTRVLAGASAE